MMKKLITGIFFLFLTLPFFAQTMQGDRLVGGTVNFGTQFFENSENIIFLNLNPNYGKFIVDNFAVGLNLGVGYSKLNQTTNTTASILPFGRYYFGEPEVIQFYVDVRGGYYIERSRNSNNTSNGSAFQIQFGPGVAFYFNENVSLDLLINYGYLGGNFNDKRLLFNFGFQIYLQE